MNKKFYVKKASDYLESLSNIVLKEVRIGDNSKKNYSYSILYYSYRYDDYFLVWIEDSIKLKNWLNDKFKNNDDIYMVDLINLDIDKKVDLKERYCFLYV